MSDLAMKLLEEEEGESTHLYYCDGLAHIGVGCLIDPKVPSDGLCQEAIDAQLFHDMAKAQSLAAGLPGFDQCNEVRQAVLVSMCFQLGSLADWPRFKAALTAADYVTAAQEGLNSRWAKEQTPLRAIREMGMLASGEWTERGGLES